MGLPRKHRGAPCELVCGARIEGLERTGRDPSFRLKDTHHVEPAVTKNTERGVRGSDDHTALRACSYRGAAAWCVSGFRPGTRRRLAIQPTVLALKSPQLQTAFLQRWQGLQKHFAPPGPMNRIYETHDRALRSCVLLLASAFSPWTSSQRRLLAIRRSTRRPAS